MRVVRRFGIATRLYWIGCLSAIAVLLLVGASVYFASRTCQAFSAFHVGRLTALARLAELETVLERHRHLVDQAAREVSDERLAQIAGAAAKLVEQMHTLAARFEGPTGRQIVSRIAEIASLGLTAFSADEPATRAVRAAAHRSLDLFANELQREIKEFRTEMVAAAEAESTRIAQSGRTLVTWVAALAAVALLAIGPINLAVIRDVAQRLQDVTKAMSRLARNDTAVEIRALGDHDEIGEIAKAVEVFRANAVTLSEQKAKLEQLNLWLDVALNNMARGLSMFDVHQRLVVSNANYARMYNLPPELVQPGTPFQKIIEHRKMEVEKIADVVVDPATVDPAKRANEIASVQGDTRTSLTMKNGKIFEVSIRPLAGGGWVAVHEDVTERRRAADQISRLARHDTLTGLANRLQFREQLEAFSRTLRSGGAFAVHCIDLDKFKEVNDTLGHPAGDALLAAVAGRIRAIVRDGDVVARLGGDEFAVIQAGATTQTAANALAQRIIDAVRMPYQIQGQRVEIGATVGIALAPADAEGPDDLLKKADMALYRSKADGRGRFSRFQQEMESRLIARRLLESDLMRAVAERQFELHYQPILDLAARRVAGCEALIRWRHPERGLVSPAEFIPVAEGMGIIPAIGEWAIETACTAASTWPDGIRVAVNLSPAQFGASDLVAVARKALGESGLEASRLELEVTESLILEDNPETVGTLHKLRALGIRFSLDDFGTGYSSLSYLRRFPFDKIKIDQSFVRDLSQRSDCVAIVGAVAQLARSLSMTTVAEGVETGDHLTKVQAAGCSEAQGFLFSRPVRASELLRAIDACNQLIASAPAAA
jgi:diguanylate cyclase (GGDEF)-like protein